MYCFKISFILANVVGVSRASASDMVTMLQATVQEKSAATIVDHEDEQVDQYRLMDTLKCASKDKHTSSEPSSFIQPGAVVQATGEDEAVVSTSSDPPGAGCLKTVLELMILFIIFDGMRRWHLQKHQAQKDGGATSGMTEDRGAAAEVAWMDMVTSATKCEVNRFEKALKQKPEMMQADAWGCTPLHFAAAGGSDAIVSQVLRFEVDVNASDASGETPLHFAARAGHASICELLLDAGAKIDAANVRGMTPLVVAGHANAVTACRLLADRGAGVAGLSDEDLPPLVVSQMIRKVFAMKQ